MRLSSSGTRQLAEEDNALQPVPGSGIDATKSHTPPEQANAFWQAVVPDAIMPLQVTDRESAHPGTL